MKQTWLGEYYDLEDNFENLRSELSDISSSKIGATQDANSVVRQFQEFERKVAPYLEIPNRIQHQIDLTKRVFGREGARLHAEKDAIKKSEELSMLLEGARNELGDSIASCFEDKLVCYSLLEHSTDIESLKSKRTELDELSDAYFSLFATQDSDKEKIKVKRTRKNVRILNYAEDMKRREKVLQIFRGLKEIYESRKWKSKDEKRFLKNLTKDCNSIARKFRRLKYQEGALEAKVLEGEILDEINESTKSTQNNKREYQYKKFGKWATLGLAGLGAATFLALSGWGLVNSARQVSQEQYKPTASQVQTHQTSQTYQTSQAFETSQEGERITEFFYEDVPKNYRYKDSIQKVTELGLMNGYPDGTFRPYSDVDKFQFAMAHY
ncbi:hypothetical protein B6U80_02540 [Candidatus Pacearchaeota archaeon ex4484_26]|nr:MAG: hypothetical protein B6U80_02540 [Candidatus Pacearchaeota archaeon ex4484_26]